MTDFEHDELLINREMSSSEYERTAVPAKARLGFGSFVGMYAGEHCAGTELMIGPLFVAAGVGAFDLLVGLLVGNILAVLSWTLMTSPIATKVRLTLYYHLERICGRHLVTIYNLANGVMFCFLAGSMITVSATAVGVFLGVPMPGLNDFYPSGIPWIATVFVLGLVISFVAAGGYQAVAWFANIAAPWMVLVFLAFGIVGLTQFAELTDTNLLSPSSLWNLASNHIWIGEDPLPGQTKFTFWHVMFFAWFCNTAMHIGMADLTVFRYAKRSWYGLSTSSGMFVGHYMAWIAASILFALQMQTSHPDEYLVGLLFDNSERFAETSREEIAALPLTPDLIREGIEIEDRMIADGELYPNQKRIMPPAPLPGVLANNACGIAGLICVIVAGWTTANPTIYRAGLAFQAISPRSSRFTITIFTGLIATCAGMFPALAMKLLDFVALYGLVLMPMGAVIFIDFWVFPKIGLKRFYAETAHLGFNWAAGLTWLLTLTVCWLMVCATWLIDELTAQGMLNLPPHVEAFIKNYLTIEIFFVSLPGWFLASFLYVVFSWMMQHRDRSGVTAKAGI